VTCLCLTRNRRQWLPKAIRYYQSQTYQNRELLILADGEDVSDLVGRNDGTSLPGREIRYVHIENGRTIGEKRNYGIRLARGGIIAHWDDDDYSAPGRLTDQLDRLSQTGKPVTGYSSMLFTDGRDWWRCKRLGGNPIGLGTSLCYRKNWWAAHPFPAKQVGEDEDFMNAANGARQFAPEDAGVMMVASIHPGNTSPRTLSGTMWKRVESPVNPIIPNL
jgi:glycosyltransferase involved in cell wall biosynthesis